MKMRVGFVTNSSSTSFLVLSKKEITPEFLFRQLGFRKNSAIAHDGELLVNEIISELTTYYRDKSRIILPIDKEYVKANFGEFTANIFEMKSARGWHAYLCSTRTESYEIVSFFTIDSALIQTRNLFIDARHCLW